MLALKRLIKSETKSPIKKEKENDWNQINRNVYWSHLICMYIYVRFMEYFSSVQHASHLKKPWN